MLFTYVSNFLDAVNLALLGLVIFYLIRGPYRRYPLLLTYCLAELAAAAAEYFVSNYGSHQVFVKLYYADEVGIDLLLFLMVIVFTYRALDQRSPMRKAAGRILTFITFGVLVLPFILFYKSIGDFAHFFSHTSELLNFGAAVMVLVMWTALLSAKERDRQLLMVSAGLGLQAAAQAIGFGIRQFLSGDQRWIADLFMMIAHLPCVWLWVVAFRPAAKTRPGLLPSEEIHPGEV
jgi:hypothetical protein